MIDTAIARETAATHGSDIVATYKRAPMKFVSGKGVELFDENGKAYLDFASGIAVNALGYGDEGVAGVVHDVMQAGLIHVSNLYRTDAGERLAHFLVEKSFASSVFFCNSGAEANEGAFKFARRWGRAAGTDAKTGIVALRGGFHGRLFASLAATDRPSYRAPFRLPAIPGAEALDVPPARRATTSGKVGGSPSASRTPSPVPASTPLSSAAPGSVPRPRGFAPGSKRWGSARSTTWWTRPTTSCSS